MQLARRLTSKFDDLVIYAERINVLNQGSGSAMVVVQNGTVVTESYSGFHSHLEGARPIQADSQFNVASCRKSYIGLAVALAVHDRRIASIDDPITDYLSELPPDLMAGTTIRHLLTHTHGLTTNDDGMILREFAPGKGWAYENVNIELLSALVRRVTGSSVREMIEERVMRPLGLTETGWHTERNPNLVQVIRPSGSVPDWALGTTRDGDQTNLFVSARELAYWGYLHLTRGRVDGRQVVPPEVITMATALQTPTLPDPGLPQNGFLWFVQGCSSSLTEIGERLPIGSYQIVGVTGPLLLIVPQYDLVVVRMYNKLYNYGGRNYLSYLREFGNQVMSCLER